MDFILYREMSLDYAEHILFYVGKYCLNMLNGFYPISKPTVLFFKTYFYVHPYAPFRDVINSLSTSACTLMSVRLCARLFFIRSVMNIRLVLSSIS